MGIVHRHLKAFLLILLSLMKIVGVASTDKTLHQERNDFSYQNKASPFLLSMSFEFNEVDEMGDKSQSMSRLQHYSKFKLRVRREEFHKIEHSANSAEKNEKVIKHSQKVETNHRIINLLNKDTQIVSGTIYNNSQNYKNTLKNNFEYDEKLIDTILDTYSIESYGGNEALSLPLLLVEPENTYIVKNKPAILKCKAAHALQINFKCSGSSQPPPSNYDKHVDPHTGTHMEDVTAIISRDLVDEFFGKGPFKCECQAWSSRGIVKSQSATISVAYIRKQFLTEPTSLRVELGSQIDLYCEPPIGNPAPKITWLKNNVALNEADIPGIYVSIKGTLSFRQVSLQDMANYTCVAENISGKRNSEIAVLIVYVNGGWSRWSSWTDCVCGSNERRGKRRLRNCSSPAPINGGLQCSGQELEKTMDCFSCTDFDWTFYLGLLSITAVFLVFGVVLIYCAKSGIESKSNHNITKAETDNTKYEYASREQRFTANKYLSRISSDHHYDVPVMSENYIKPFDELSINYMNDTVAGTSTSTSNSTYGLEVKLHTLLSSKNEFSKLTATQGVIYSGGGRLQLYNSEIMLYIPHLSIEKNHEKSVTLIVLSDEAELLSIPCMESFNVRSAIVQCAPFDCCFLKPVILKVPHCLTNTDQWNINIYYSGSCHDDLNLWRIISSVGNETLNTPIFTHMGPSHAYLMTERLGCFVLIADPKSNIPVADISIRMRFFVFLQMTPNSYILRIYVLRDFPYSKDICSCVETQIGGTFLKESRAFRFNLDNNNLKILVRPASEYILGHPVIEGQEQIIPYAHIISNNSFLHCEFTFKREEQDCVNIGLDIAFMQNHNNRSNEYLRISISDKSRSSRCRSPNDRLALYLNENGNCINDFVDLETIQVPPLTKRKICAALDPPRIDENDWRLLARKLNSDRYIAYFATKSSPTEQILNLLECRTNNSANTIIELLAIFADMDRHDVVHIIEQTIGQQWI